MDLNDAWELFLSNSGPVTKEESVTPLGDTPNSSPLYVSTNTIISFLNQPIDLKTVFWQIPVIPYNSPHIGVIKKQMKFNSVTPEEVSMIEQNMSSYEYSHCNIIQHIDNPKGIIKYKDVRKVTVGISKKDIVSYRVKPKGAFYNCFVMILRVQIEGGYKEFHVKIFNTGKIEIPGVQRYDHLNYIIDLLLSILRVYHSKLMYNKSCEETVLINSNFNCGYFINRTELYQLLKYKYRISAVYDPCSYPGIQCKIYYKEGVVTTVEHITVSFMIFRTGSILIVGKCTQEVIEEIYDYLTKILSDEYSNVVDHNCVHSKKETTIRKIKRNILIT
jgi:TATA-box binding protein (TBP) (component of TFIID and TFIIIB)